MNTKNTLQNKKRRIATAVAFFLLLLLQLVLLYYYGCRKAGFHEDEFYSYYSTNKTAGLFVDDREWMERDSFRNDFVVLEGERFRYDIVKQMQSWDVHPPFYYYILHTACSLFPGVFSKWLGISVNLIAFVPCFFLLALLVYCSVSKEREAEEEGNDKRAVFLAFTVCLSWGFSAAVISGVMFIRMYQWLTLFVLLCAWLHVRALKKQDFGLRFLIPLAITVFLGFMTQYYYIIFHVFIGAGFCFLLLKEKKIKPLAGYVLFCVLSLLAAILYYPSSLSHIFRGYRGTEAVSEFANVDNTFERLTFFLQLFDQYVMNGSLCVVLLLICLLWITVSYLGKKEKTMEAARLHMEDQRTRQVMGLLLFACVGYFFTISKTALILGETSNRYQLPIYGILIFLLVFFLYLPVEILLVRYRKHKESEKIKLAAAVILTAAIVLTDAAALKNGRVFFLYEEEKAVMEYVRANKEVPVIVFYNDASKNNVWRLSDELMEFPKVYLASQGNDEMISDEKLTDSDRLLVYVADYDDSTACLERLLEDNENLSGYHMIAEKGLWTLYEIE